MAGKDAKPTAKDEEKKDDAAAGADGEAAAAAPKKRFAGKKLILLVVLPALLLIGGGAGAYMMLFRSAPHAEASEHAPTPPPRPPSVFMNLPEMIVNLNTGQRRANFLKINVSLELGSQADVPRIEALMPRIVDTFQVYLRELRVEDLRGSAGMFRLREELLARVNHTVQPVAVSDVLFREMLVQ